MNDNNGLFAIVLGLILFFGSAALGLYVALIKKNRA